MILFIKHIGIEGPETLGDFFQSRGETIKVLDLSRGDALVGDLSDVDAMVCLGGPMNVYEEEKYPFLKDEDVFIKKILAQEIPFLGICLGSQLLAKACGASVTKSPVKEVGWSTVELTPQGKSDALFQGLGETLEVFQWHEDTFAIPAQGTWLAKSAGCAHQAFKVGNCAYGFQFHVEITDKNIREWSEAYLGHDPRVLASQRRVLLELYREKQDSFRRTADRIYRNFARFLAGSRARR